MIENNLKKIHFSKDLSEKTGFPFSVSKKIIDDLIIIYSEMIKNNNLILKNIGSFKLIEKKERLGRNPKTNKEYLISKRKSIRFIVSKNLSYILNEMNG